MPRYTSAYGEFVSRLEEVTTLIQLALSYERLDPIGKRRQINAVCRGSVVLLCGRVEAYVGEVGELAWESMYEQQIGREGLPDRAYYYISKDLLDEICGAREPDRVADRGFAFINRDADYWSKAGPLAAPIPTERFSGGFGNPTFKRVKKYFNRFGYEEYGRDLASELRAQFQPTVAMVDHLVDTRNKVAHGDADIRKTPRELQQMVSIVKLFCRATDGVFATWWKGRYCAIR